MSSALQVLSDSGGTISAGFLAPDIYYVRVVDHVSSGLGIGFGTQLRRHLGDATAVTCFFDVSSAHGGDFAARSAIMRALLANRRQLVSIKVLVSPGPVAARARALSAMLGGATHVIDSAAVFNAQLREAAPAAQRKLPASGRMPIARSMRPRARSGTHG
jgi:hypothetical protein